MQNKRQIVLDTETTGMNQEGGMPYVGHRIIEIGAVEVINRRLTGNHLHIYLNPERTVDVEAFQVHGISDEFLKDKPKFKSIAESFIQFIDQAELIIHNAPFDVGFMDNEFRMAGIPFVTQEHCQITDTLVLAKKMFPGKRNNLDVLAQRYDIDNSHRTLHGALLDAEILAEVYLAMTGGQTTLSLSQDEGGANSSISDSTHLNVASVNVEPTRVILATEEESKHHQSMLDLIDKKSGGAMWRKDRDTQ